MHRNALHRRPSLIQNPQLNLILTGSGVAFQLQHIILLFLADPETVWTLDLFALNQVSVNLYRVTITWRQVDTPSVASVRSLSSDEE